MFFDTPGGGGLEILAVGTKIGQFLAVGILLAAKPPKLISTAIDDVKTEPQHIYLAVGFLSKATER